MNTNKQTTTKAGGLLPSSLVDRQLDHLENMLQYVLRANMEGDLSRLDRTYWEKRVRELAGTHDLVASQRNRVTRLLGNLERAASNTERRRAAA
ncbi:hypothetical protein [Paraburkholderia sp.]|uniref:hypothetical protein n=1 Tax=Paraburkholderia sp. TaxID=1926495 RepID=UPI002399650C|nr:hypothetical protein [Paraburkholderia sp.]MDE1182435.1 hypothetical protein [Paraburkholderia sp.]